MRGAGYLAPPEATFDDIRRAVRRLKAVALELKSRDCPEMFCLRIDASGVLSALRQSDMASMIRCARSAQAIADAYPSKADWARLSKAERSRVTPERLAELRFRVSVLRHFINRYGPPPRRRRRRAPVRTRKGLR